mmetsp:Transcript_102442/g.228782  ORF Transcript_102442/g.228782 Transcript_102442/m.228782 type:complete len:256 (-) Transcript_102442:455-1222(-)
MLPSPASEHPSLVQLAQGSELPASVEASSLPSCAFSSARTTRGAAASWGEVAGRGVGASPTATAAAPTSGNTSATCLSPWKAHVARAAQQGQKSPSGDKRLVGAGGTGTSAASESACVGGVASATGVASASGAVGVADAVGKADAVASATGVAGAGVGASADADICLEASAGAGGTSLSGTASRVATHDSQLVRNRSSSSPKERPTGAGGAAGQAAAAGGGGGAAAAPAAACACKTCNASKTPCCGDSIGAGMLQ